MCIYVYIDACVCMYGMSGCWWVNVDVDACLDACVDVNVFICFYICV